MSILATLCGTGAAVTAPTAVPAAALVEEPAMAPQTAPTPPAPPKVIEPKTLTPPAKPVPAKAATSPAKAAPLPAAPPKPAVAAPAQDDYAAYAAMDQLKDVVKEVVRRGAKDFAQVQAVVQDMADSGACPLLVRIGAHLSDRLVSTCTAMRLPGTAGAAAATA